MSLVSSATAKLLDDSTFENSGWTTLGVASIAGYSTSVSGDTWQGIIAEFITIFISIIGIIFLILIILSGINWMTAGGDKDKVEKSKTRIKEAVIGLGIVIAAYLITYAVMYYLGQSIGLTTGLQ